MKKRVVNLFDSNELPDRNLTIKELLEMMKDNEDKLRKANEIIESIESSSSATAEPIPFAHDLPTLLNALNLKSVILTNNSRQSVDNYLHNDKLNYLQGFGSIITRDDVATMKPDPAGLLYILDKFNATKKNVVYIGDSYIDSEAAHAAGIPFILINTRNLDVNGFSFKPYKIFTNLKDLIPFIQNDLLDCIF